jgi:hypothetical protein
LNAKQTAQIVTAGQSEAGAFAPASADQWIAAALVSAGALIIVGVALPWLTLYAGLQQYNGTMGLYGWLLIGAGSGIVIAGFITLRVRVRWLAPAIMSLGLALFAFASWLLAGLSQIVHSPQSIMLVPRPGPGLYVILIGAVLLILTPLISKTRAVLVDHFSRMPARRS